MSREMLLNLFQEACSNSKGNECIRFVSESATETVTYEEMESMIEEIDVCSQEWINQCIGIVCGDIDPPAVAIMMGITKAKASFVFIDALSKDVWNVIDRLNIRFFVAIRKTNFHDHELSVRDDLSSTKFFSNYRVLERNNVTSCEQSSDIAFVAFSSGSTGSSKTIRIPFRSIVPNVIDLKNLYKLQPSDTLYVSAPPTFDPCVLDIFLALSSGCRLLLAATSVKFDETIVTSIFSGLATVCYLTPSVFAKTFPKHMERTSLRILTFGGESFPPNLNSAMYSCLRNVNVYNIYGMTEVSCWASIELVESLENPSLGAPLTDTIFEVRNRDGEVISEGIGELFIGSYNRICVLEGEDDSNITKPCFRASGDVVEIKDGQYFYIGRTDRRIKILGHRIDLASIDGLLSSHSSVKHCRSIFLGEENVIVTLVVPLSNDITVENIQAYLQRQFSSYVLPNTILLVPEIPLNKHGKVCEKTCEHLYRSSRRRENDLPREFELLWQKYTSGDGVVPEDMGFIECGGNSVLALQFTAALSNVSSIPNDFIVALLSNAKYSRCLEMIVAAGSPTPCHKRCPNEVESDEKRTRKVAKLERNFGRFERVMSRGKTEEVVNRNEHDAFSAAATVGSSMKVKWKHDMAKCVDASPTALVYEKNSIVVCGSHSGQLLIVDVVSGDVLTSIVLPDRIESSACASSCGKYIFLGCYDHKMYCIDLCGGVIVWTFETGDMVKSTPVYSDDKLYFGSYDRHFYCLTRGGQLLWKTNVDESSIYASAVVEKHVIGVATLGGTVAFLEHDGTVKRSLRFGKPFFSSPCTITGDMCVTIDVTGTVRLLHTITGREVWQYKVDGNVFSGVSRYRSGTSSERERIVFGCHDKRVYCLEVGEEGIEMRWRVEVYAAVYATPFCYRSSVSSYLVLIATTTGAVYVVNAIDGAVVKSCSMEGDVFSSPVVVHSSAIFGCRNNYLYAVDIS